MTAWLEWWQTLQENPIFLREKGEWGNPNPLYAKVTRYSPFVIMAALFLGICSGTTNSQTLTTANSSAILLCILFFPTVILSVLSLFGVFMAPVLTAPSISFEKDRGTWDMLLLTPYSVRTILLAKLFGGLSRLRIWLLVLVLSIIRAALFVLISQFAGYDRGIASNGFLLGFGFAVQPLLEIFYAGVLGMFISTWLRSATMALMSTYIGVAITKAVNGIIWITAVSLFALNPDGNLSLINLATPLLYAILSASLLAGILYRADKIQQEI